jgi:hypothetical protein
MASVTGRGDFTHGAGGYSNHGCRCPVCTKANTERINAYRRRRQQRTGERLVNGYFVSAKED